jgi:phosphotransferase system enzyme I (PtsI)
MRVERGKPAAPGFGDGRAFVYRAEPPVVPRHTIAPQAARRERARFEAAVARAAARLELLGRSAAAELGPAEAEIFAAHLAFLRDPQFLERVGERIRARLENAEQAVAGGVDELADALSKVDDEYLRERARDIRDLGRWVLRQLVLQDEGALAELPPQTVLVAHELLPSDLLRVDRSHLAGIVTEAGGEVGHAAILARSLGIPYVTGVHHAAERIHSGERVLLDGQTGEVWIDPDSRTLPGFIRRQQRYDRERTLALSEERRECVTRDGVRVFLHANIGHPEEAAEVERHNLDGVGLFRTEYMFLDEREPPSLERQRQVYREAAAFLGDRPLVIRTLDLGGDKRPAFLAPHFESNPRLGLRGLRFSLTVGAELFRTQLRAIVQAAEHRDIRVLFPMVLGGHDLHAAIALLQQICREERLFRPLPIGAMVETPSAVFTIAQILDMADFVSIGTNDLTQYMLAADRNAADVVEDYSAAHPAMLRAIRDVVQAADAKRRPVSVCGEAAADPATAGVLVGLGIRALSMSPASAARVRQLLRHVASGELERLARTGMAAEDPREVERLAADLSAGRQVAG